MRSKVGRVLLSVGTLLMFSREPALGWVTLTNSPVPKRASGRWTPPPVGTVCSVGNGVPAVYVYDATNEPAGLGAAAVIAAAHQTWNDDRGSDAEFRQVLGQCSCEAHGSGASCIGWWTPPLDQINEPVSTTVSSIAAGTLVEFDICLNATYPWGGAAGQYDLHTAVLRELGHALGLGHPDAKIEVPQPWLNGQRAPVDYRSVVMTGVKIPPLPGPGAINRELSCDDKAGANFLCPPAGLVTEARRYLQSNTGGCDLGDASAFGYPTLIISNGARHKDSRMEWLGPIPLAATADPPYPQQVERIPNFAPVNFVWPTPRNGFQNPYPGSVVAGQTDGALANDTVATPSTVAAGDKDVGVVFVIFNDAERHADANGTGTFEVGEAIYNVGGFGAAPTVAAGYRRLTAAIVSTGPLTSVTYRAGTVVAATDRDVGTPLKPFQATERHTNPNNNGAYDPGEGIYRTAPLADTVALGQTRLVAPAFPASATFEVDALFLNLDELDDGVSFRSRLAPGARTLVDVLVRTSGVPNRYDPLDPGKRLYLNAWADWNGNGSWKDWTTVADTPPLLGPGGVPPCMPAGVGEEYVLHWQGTPTADQLYAPSFCGGIPVGPNARLLTFVIRPPAIIGLGARPVGELTLDPFYHRFRLDYAENAGQHLRDFSDPTLVIDDLMGNRRAVTPADRLAGIGFDQGEAAYGEVEDHLTTLLRHFLCYETHRPRRDIKDVSLKDQFGQSKATIKRAKRICLPANKNAEDPGAAGDPAHLTAYSIKQTTPRFKRIRNVKVTNQFGSLVVDVGRPDRLLVPTAKNLFEAPGPLVHPTDHYKCYRTVGARFRKSEILAGTQFGQTRFDIKRPTHLCAPVDKKGEGIADSASHLMCYKVETRFFRGPVSVHTLNQFGPDHYEVFGLRELCVPSIKTLPAPAPTPVP